MATNGSFDPKGVYKSRSDRPARSGPDRQAISSNRQPPPKSHTPSASDTASSCRSPAASPPSAYRPSTAEWSPESPASPTPQSTQSRSSLPLRQSSDPPQPHPR